MNRKFGSRHACATALLLVLASVPPVTQAQQHSGSEMKHSGGEMKHSGGHSADASHKQQGSAELTKSMQESQSKMQSMTMTGETDHDFAEMMRMHHQAGVNMAQIELKHGTDPAMKKMAEKIMASQKKEIKEFDQWLQKHK